MTDNTDVVFPSPVYKCDECNKTYAIKGSYQSHMRLKHKANKASEVLENGNNTSKKKPSSGYHMWTENEIGDMPLMLTRKPYLDKKNDSSLVAAAVESQEDIENEIMIQKRSVKDHKLNGLKRTMIQPLLVSSGVTLPVP